MAEPRIVRIHFGSARTIARELIAIGLWSYILLKLFVFDVDIFLFKHLVPQFQRVLDFRAFVILGLLAIGLVAQGRKKFLSNLLYTLAYPLILVFWRLPSLALKQWPLTIAFAPVIYRAVSTFPTTFLLYTMAALCGLFITISNENILVSISMSGLLFFLSAHLYRSFREAYYLSLTPGLVTFLKQFKDEVRKGIFDHVPTPPTNTQPAQEIPGNAQQKNPATLYLLRSLTDIIVDQVRWVARSRKYDLYLILSWFYSVSLVVIVFAFEFLGLSSIDPTAFGAATRGTNFSGYLGFSLGNLPLGRISDLKPVSQMAVLFTYAEELYAAIVFVILVFIVLTAARESYKADLDLISSEVTAIAEALDSRITEVYSMSIVEVEIFLLQNNAGLVNSLRKARGLSELAAPAEHHIAGAPAT